MFKAVKISLSASCSLTSGKLMSALFAVFASSEVLDSPEEEHKKFQACGRKKKLLHMHYFWDVL